VTPKSQNLRAVVLMIAAMAGFAVADAFIKYATEFLAVSQVILFMGLGGTTVFVALAKFQGVTLLSAHALNRAVLLRNGIEILATLGVVISLANAPLSTVSAIMQAAPILVTLGAIVFFNEKVGWRRWTAIFMGFVGVMMILRPGSAVFDIYLLVALGGTIALAGRDLTTRAVPKEIPSIQLSVYGFSMVIPTGLILMALGSKPVPVTLPAVMPMVFGIFFVVIAYYCITAAMRSGSIAIVAPFRYSRLIFGLALGMIVFGERPDAMTLAGAALVIVSGLYALSRDRKVKETVSAA
jgi:drug/metabolite transporter (DMT)-like permease